MGEIPHPGAIDVDGGVERDATKSGVDRADMRGVWLNESLGCDQWRRIRVRILVSFSPPGASRSRLVRKVKTGIVQNCAEGGPNTGFTVRASGLGFGCPNGRWRPGRYDFVTRTRHLASGLVATASAGWRVRAAC